MLTAPEGSVLPTLVQVYEGAGGPTASQRNVISWPEDVVVSVGVTVKRGGPVCVCVCVCLWWAW